MSGGGGRAGKVTLGLASDAFWDDVGGTLFRRRVIASVKLSFWCWIGARVTGRVVSLETADGRLGGAFRKTWSRPVTLFPVVLWDEIWDEILALQVSWVSIGGLHGVDETRVAVDDIGNVTHCSLRRKRN